MVHSAAPRGPSDTTVKKILVTGASGMLGRHIAAGLRRHGFDVVGTSRRGDPDAPFPMLSADLASGPLRLDTRPEAIVHCAALATLKSRDTAAFERNNVDAARSLADFATRSGARQIVNLSTIAVYGAVDGEIVDERTPTRCEHPYGTSKLQAEQVFAAMGAAVPTISLRLPGVVCKGATEPWIARLYRALAAHEDVRAENKSALFNNILHVDTLTAFIASLLGTPPKAPDVLTLASSAPITIEQVIGLVAERTASRSRIEIGASGKKPFCISIDRATTMYGFQPLTTAQSIERYVADAI